MRLPALVATLLLTACDRPGEVVRRFDSPDGRFAVVVRWDTRSVGPTVPGSASDRAGYVQLVGPDDKVLEQSRVDMVGRVWSSPGFVDIPGSVIGARGVTTKPGELHWTAIPADFTFQLTLLRCLWMPHARSTKPNRFSSYINRIPNPATARHFVLPLFERDSIDNALAKRPPQAVLAMRLAPIVGRRDNALPCLSGR